MLLHFTALNLKKSVEASTFALLGSPEQPCKKSGYPGRETTWRGAMLRSYEEREKSSTPVSQWSLQMTLDSVANYSKGMGTSNKTRRTAHWRPVNLHKCER